MRTEDFEFELPSELIAQRPAPEREQSRLMVLDRARRTVMHRRFIDLPDLLNPGDAMFLNDSRVIRARLRARKEDTGGGIELFLCEEISVNEWSALLRPAKRIQPGQRLEVLDPARSITSLNAVVLDRVGEGLFKIHFEGCDNVMNLLESIGEVPLPPYIERTDTERDAKDGSRYQTVFSQTPGSVAAPTAGLHFTADMLDALEERGIRRGFVTLHVGLGTFAPVKTPCPSDHVMHEERFALPEETARLAANTRAESGRIVAVGSTSLRVLESAARMGGLPVKASAGRTGLFLFPPAEFLVANTLLTNFHLPRSTLLMLVCAFASPGGVDGREWILECYAQAVKERYRFFSFGDAMLIL